MHRVIPPMGLLTLCAFLVWNTAQGQSGQMLDFNESDITSPSTSLRCYELNKRRRQKITHKQNLKSLISRNNRLLKITKEDDDREFYQNLLRTQTRLKFELELALQKILNSEEALVKTGCPNLLQ